MFLIELKRGFSRLSFKVALFIGLIFCVLSILQTTGSNNNLLTAYTQAYVDTPFDKFIFFNLNPVSNILIIILPIISTMSYSDSYLEDVSSGFIKFIYTREKKQKYLFFKYFSNFIVSGIAFALPLLINLIALILLYPSTETNPILGKPTIMYGGLFPQLFYTHPILYIFMWIIIYFLYAGALSSISLTFGIVVQNKFVNLIIPFILYIVSGIVLGLAGLHQYDMLQFLYLSNYQDFHIIILDFIVIIFATLPLFLYGGCKNGTN